MAGRAFSPPTVTIEAGGTVTFLNDDDDQHTATSIDGAFDTGTLSPGERRQQQFANPGTYAFLCAFHSGMTGEIVVEGASGAAPSPATAETGALGAGRDRSAAPVRETAGTPTCRPTGRDLWRASSWRSRLSGGGAILFGRAIAGSVRRPADR
jgi:hypothetical protein